MNVFFVVVAIVVAVVAQIAYLSRVTDRRRRTLQQRPPFPLSDWELTNPDVSLPILSNIIEVIASGISVEPCFLRPEDTFDGSLARGGAFVIDDDTTEDVADMVEEKLGITWQREWKTVQDAIDGISKELRIRC